MLYSECFSEDAGWGYPSVAQGRVYCKTKDDQLIWVASLTGRHTEPGTKLTKMKPKIPRNDAGVIIR